MLKNEPLLNVLVIDVILGTIWHFAVFFLCVFIDKNFFDEKKRMYLPRKWERGGRFYSDVLKINKWKDELPSHVGKDGFSKDHFDNASAEYIDEFIMETCRGEWDHKINCVFVLVLFLLNDIGVAFLLSIILLAGNLPFVIIQRYNRFRLQRVRDMMQRRSLRMERDHQ